MDARKIKDLAERAVLAGRAPWSLKLDVTPPFELRNGRTRWDAGVIADGKLISVMIVKDAESESFTTWTRPDGSKNEEVSRWVLNDGRWNPVLTLHDISAGLLKPHGAVRSNGADRALRRMRLVLPRRYREVLLGDLAEDLAAMREEGYTEKQLCQYVYLQVLYALQPWNWVKAAAVAWIVGKVGGVPWIARLMR